MLSSDIETPRSFRWRDVTSINRAKNLKLARDVPCPWKSIPMDPSPSAFYSNSADPVGGHAKNAALKAPRFRVRCRSRVLL
jgi:hypothetical protein